MFDIGGWEFLIVIVIAIIVIGPKDLPGAIRTITGWIRRARQLAQDFQSGLDDLARETDMDNLKDEIQSNLGLDDITNSGNTIRNQIKRTIDPNGNIDDTFREDYWDVEDDRPFADNNFEEDEDLDETEFNDLEELEDIAVESDGPQKIVSPEDSTEEETYTQAKKKAET
ncbi:Sec-independent protein translocase protein TatB [Alphaproteobacteria bacterium]|nr:Sec-independent protein translocase protein TatB [Alphaproteobacteria bacterium]